MNIRFIVVTEKTPDYFIEARKEYEKRLGRYCKLKTVSVRGSEKVEKALDEKAPTVLVRRGGDLLSSEELADLISRAEVSGISSINLVVGEDYNPSEGGEVRSFSISPVGLSEDLVSVVVLEQIYRAYKIINGEKYHK